MESIFLMPGLSIAAFIAYAPIIVAIVVALILLFVVWFKASRWKFDRDLEKSRAESDADYEKFRELMREIGSDEDC